MDIFPAMMRRRIPAVIFTSVFPWPCIPAVAASDARSRELTAVLSGLIVGFAVKSLVDVPDTLGFAAGETLVLFSQPTSPIPQINRNRVVFIWRSQLVLIWLADLRVRLVRNRRLPRLGGRLHPGQSLSICRRRPLLPWLSPPEVWRPDHCRVARPFREWSSKRPFHSARHAGRRRSGRYR